MAPITNLSGISTILNDQNANPNDVAAISAYSEAEPLVVDLGNAITLAQKGFAEFKLS